MKENLKMERGYESMFAYYEKVSPDLNSLPGHWREPLYARSACTVIVEKMHRNHEFKESIDNRRS